MTFELDAELLSSFSSFLGAFEVSSGVVEAAATSPLAARGAAEVSVDGNGGGGEEGESSAEVEVGVSSIEERGC